MALDYTTLFGDLGAIIARLNSYQTLGGTTLAADLDDLLTQFETRWLPHEGVAAYYEGLRDQVTGWRQGLASFADRRVQDQATVQDELRLRAAGLAEVLAALDRKMREDAKEVKACGATATDPEAAEEPANRGDGAAFVTLTLDGYNSPVRDGPASIYYDGVQTEMTVPSETMTLTCTADGVQDGLAEGAEVFGWSGGPQWPPLDVRAEGSGSGPSINVANGESLISGKDFDAFTSGVPSGWTVASGSGNTAQETTQVFRGDSCLKFTGNAALTQAVSPTVLTGRRRYFVGVAARLSGALPGAQFRLYFTGTGWSGPDVCSVTGTQLSASAWSLIGGFVTMPSPIPSDWTLAMAASGLTGSGVSLYVASMAFKPVDYHGGVGCVVVAGQTPWQRGDRLTFSVTNDGAGKFQTFARRHWRRQLPSVRTGMYPSAQGLLLLLQGAGGTTVTETVSDSLVA